MTTIRELRTLLNGKDGDAPVVLEDGTHVDVAYDDDKLALVISREKPTPQLVATKSGEDPQA